MSEDNYNNPPEEQNPDFIDENEPIGKMEAVTGIITEPSATFERIAGIKPRIYWVAPIFIFIIASLIAVFLFYSDKELYSSVMDKQINKLEERFDKSIKEGKATEEQKILAIEMTKKFALPSTIAFSIIGPFIIILLMSLIYLVCLKVLKGEANFTNIMNVVGLSLIIGAIAKILETVLSIILGTLSNFSLGIVLSEASVGSTVHALIMKFDVFSIWSVIIICIGLIKVGKLKNNTMYFLVFGIWILLNIIFSLLIPM